MLKWNKIFCLRTREIERQTFITPVASSCCYYSSLLLAFCCCPRFCQAGNTTVWKTYADICPALEKAKKSICALSPLIHADTCWHSMCVQTHADTCRALNLLVRHAYADTRSILDTCRQKPDAHSSLGKSKQMPSMLISWYEHKHSKLDRCQACSSLDTSRHVHKHGKLGIRACTRRPPMRVMYMHKMVPIHADTIQAPHLKHAK